MAQGQWYNVSSMLYYMVIEADAAEGHSAVAHCQKQHDQLGDHSGRTASTVCVHVVMTWSCYDRWLW